MKRYPTKLLGATLLATAALCLSATASASQVTMGLFDSGSSGHYRANPNADLEWVLGNYASGKSTDGTWFGTFCIEFNEYFHDGHTYDAAINNGSVRGGVSGAINGKDVLSVGTAFLYENFALGTLADFEYGNALNAEQLQNTIWFLEGEIFGDHDFGSYLALAQSLSNWSDDYTGSAVKVLNMTKSSQGGQISHHQDQLVFVGHAVPDSGATLGLLALGLAGMATLRRRTRRA